LKTCVGANTQYTSWNGRDMGIFGVELHGNARPGFVDQEGGQDKYLIILKMLDMVLSP